MAIDIRNINEITFTQSFRGYNTDEVDDFLDDLYEEAVENNKKIQELEKRISELESGAASSEPASQDTYNVIADAQQEADRILENARRKAHALIESAESMKTEVPSHSAEPKGALSTDATNKLKELFNDMYQKQMAILESCEQPKKEVQEELPENDVPSISFAGIANETPQKIPAERDILGEINSIELGEFKPIENTYDSTPSYEEISNKEISREEEFEEDEEDTGGLAFAFAEPDEVIKKQEPVQYSTETKPEDPDDIIAQILRDNNRN